MHTIYARFQTALGRATVFRRGRELAIDDGYERPRVRASGASLFER